MSHLVLLCNFYERTTKKITNLSHLLSQKKNKNKIEYVNERHDMKMTNTKTWKRWMFSHHLLLQPPQIREVGLCTGNRLSRSLLHFNAEVYHRGEITGILQHCFSAVKCSNIKKHTNRNSNTICSCPVIILCGNLILCK